VAMAITCRDLVETSNFRTFFQTRFRRYRAAAPPVLVGAPAREVPIVPEVSCVAHSFFADSPNFDIGRT